MTNLDPSPQISQDNIGIRERGISSAREYSRMVETFIRVLQTKESFRLSIESKLSSIGQQVKDNIDNLETLMRNINIYKQNIDKISNNLGQLQAEENSIKARYEELLNGSTSMDSLVIGEDKNNDDLDPADSRAYLIQRRRSYLENLDQSFKHLDGELLSIEKLHSELTRARSEILIKKDEAENQMRTLEKNGARHLEDVRRIEKELESSIDEERLIVNEFKRLVKDSEKILEINDEVDHILFTYLTAEESKDRSSKTPVSAVE